jgi:hypothetical protein
MQAALCGSGLVAIQRSGREFHENNFSDQAAADGEKQTPHGYTVQQDIAHTFQQHLLSHGVAPLVLTSLRRDAWQEIDSRLPSRERVLLSNSKPTTV